MRTPGVGGEGRVRSIGLGRLPVRVTVAEATALALAVVLGVALVASPLVVTLLAAVIVVVAFAVAFPITTTCTYFTFVLVQDLLLNFAPDSGPMYMALKRGDEVMLLVLLSVTLLRHRSLRLPILARAYRLLLGALAIGVISTALFADAWLLAAFDVFLLTKGFIVLYVVSQLPLERKHVIWSLYLVLAAGVLCLFAAGADLLLGDTYRAWIHHPKPIELRRGWPTIVAIFGHPGVAGWFFACCACVALAFWVVWRNGTYFVLCLLFTVGSLLSLRRKPLVGLVGVFILALLLSAKTRSTLRTMGAAVLIVGAMGYTAGDVILGIFQDMLTQYVYAPDLMAVARNAMFKTSLLIGMDHFPLGAGFGRFGGWISALYYSPLYYEYGLSNVYGLSEAQPSFLQDAFWPHVIGELGFVGAALFIGALALLVAPHLQGGGSADPRARAVRYAAVFCFLEAVPESFGWVVFENTLAASWIFGLLALATVAPRLMAPRPKSTSGSVS